MLENVEKRSEFVHTQRIALYKSDLLLLFIKTRAVPCRVCKDEYRLKVGKEKGRVL